MEENIRDLKNRIEDKLQLRIEELEGVQKDLLEDIKTSTAEEKEKNQTLLIATTSLLEQLKQARSNIHDLVNKA